MVSKNFSELRMRLAIVHFGKYIFSRMGNAFPDD